MVDLVDRTASRKEHEELAFRYSTLLAAQRILDEQYERAVHRPKKDHLNLERLRRLKAYVGNAITALDRRMGGPEKRNVGPTSLANGPPDLTQGAAGQRVDSAAE